MVKQNLGQMHQIREQQSLEIHRKVAAMMMVDPVRVRQKAVDNILRWSQRDGVPEAAHMEWLGLLEQMSTAELADFLISDSPRAVRMRQSSPFAGVLSPKEVWGIKRGHHEVA